VGVLIKHYFKTHFVKLEELKSAWPK